MLSAYNATPPIGHLKAALHAFSYLNSHDRSKLVMDDAYPDHPEVLVYEWKEFYPFAKDSKPPDTPAPRGKPVVITVCVSASHAANLVTRRSQTGALISAN